MINVRVILALIYLNTEKITKPKAASEELPIAEEKVL